MVLRIQLLGLGLLGGIAASCSSSDSSEQFKNCAIGSLSGTWRTHYADSDGNCGTIPDETTAFGAPPPAGCVVHSSAISADKCRMDLDSTCPLADGKGTQRWTLVLRQVAANRLEGTGTAQVNHPTLGTCRGTYSVTMSKL
jgi:hypothetical protein